MASDEFSLFPTDDSDADQDPDQSARTEASRARRDAARDRASEAPSGTGRGRPDADLREETAVPTGGREDLREADRRGKLAEPSDVTTPGAIADKIRALRKELAERRARKGSERLQNARDKQARRKPLREAKQEALRAADESPLVKKAVGVASKAVGAASKVGTGTDVGARRPAPRDDGRDTDPVVRAGETAKAGAPMDATLAPFGGPRHPAGARQLMLMAGGGTPRERARRRRERGVEDIQTFATMGLDVAPIAGGVDPDDDQDTIYAGNPLDVDSAPLVDDDNGGML